MRRWTFQQDNNAHTAKISQEGLISASQTSWITLIIRGGFLKFELSPSEGSTKHRGIEDDLQEGIGENWMTMLQIANYFFCRFHKAVIANDSFASKY